MSTEHQQYSTQNQSHKIREYAQQRGYTISRTYADDGKSGLSIAGREGLKRLLADVQAGGAPFGTILVYDISRWGRFQDADESAYYEYICRRAGINVVYCAEQFENDGSPGATIIKSVKRAMAGEYSRELSVKVFAGQCRLIELGFRQGGPAGFALKRVLIDQAGNRKGELSRGERKSIQNDRVVLVPGSEEDIATVRFMYQCLIDGMQESKIAKLLNDKGVSNGYGDPWLGATVHEVLTNEKYVGANVFNRTSFKLKHLHVENPPEMWVRKDDAFAPIVPRAMFDQVQAVLRARQHKFTDAEILSHLRQILAKTGKLSRPLINGGGMVSAHVVSLRFGGLYKAYRIVGYQPEWNDEHLEIGRRIKELQPEIMAQTRLHVETRGGAAEFEDETYLCINDEFKVSIQISRCRRTPGGRKVWRLRWGAGYQADITLAVRMNETNTEPQDYYLFPRCILEDQTMTIGEFNHAGIESFRFDGLGSLSRLTARIEYRRAA